ncbi:MAG: hypothetical protein LBT64_02940 [Puniceicoccales bacterium]|jgi:hypothetical protein|nr:hypothetical protein [Puniceicoccales bacterium]
MCSAIRGNAKIHGGKVSGTNANSSIRNGASKSSAQTAFSKPIEKNTPPTSLSDRREANCSVTQKQGKIGATSVEKSSVAIAKNIHKKPDKIQAKTKKIAEGSAQEQTMRNHNSRLSNTIGASLQSLPQADQADILKRGEKMLAEKRSDEDAAAKCKWMAELHSEIAGDLNGCTAAQKSYILRYGKDAIANGYGREFVAEICKSMSILYADHIEDLLPDRIDISGTVSSAADVAMRKAAEAQLSKTMAANGADYGIISTCIREQRFSQYNNEPQAMQYYLLTQRQDMNEDVATRYYIYEGNVDDLKKSFDTVCGGNVEKYAKSIAMLKAYTAIALNKIDFPGKDKKNETCTLQRGMLHRTCIQYPGYACKKQGDVVNNLKNGIMCSTALGPPSEAFSDNIHDIHGFKIPYTNVHMAYFMHTEFCADNSEEKSDGKMSDEHEFVCDVGMASAKILKIAERASEIEAQHNQKN